MSSSSLELRSYQKDAIDAIRKSLRAGNSRALVVLPCGSGKSVVMAVHVADLLQRSPKARVLVLVPRVRLVKQLRESLLLAGLTDEQVGVYCAELKRKEAIQSVVVATYASAHKMPHPFQPFDLIVLDECHTYDPADDSLQRELLERQSHGGTRVVGYTATPYRGARLLWRLGKEAFWHEPVFTLPMKSLPLCPAKLIGSDEEFSTKGLRLVRGEWDQEQVGELGRDVVKLNKQLDDALEKLDIHNRRSCVWITIDQSHSRMVQDALLARGETAVRVISDDEVDERGEALQAFEDQRARHLVSVAIVTMGYDNPKVDALVFLRPTRSIVSYIQAVGRAMRPHPSKSYSTILDFGGVVAACGPVDRPAAAQDDTGTDQGRKSRERIMEDLGYKVVRCEKCGSFFFPSPKDKPDCTECGHTQSSFEKMKKLLDKSAGGDLYADEPEVFAGTKKQYVVGCKVMGRGDWVDVLFMGQAGGLHHEILISLWAPLSLPRKITPYDMGRLKRTKAFIRDAFNGPFEQGFSARDLAHWLLEGKAKKMPRLMVMRDGDWRPEGLQDFAQETTVQRALQEDLGVF